ncbi:transglutaminase TgpA family protein [Desulfogranum mediterraneum]|uniref:transglutaminase TgpA family protein n=1 Tax=Desulfogranum mediterraneum TaxID=160661 RepID=UPI0003FA0B8C|nr:DUF3488 and transglutaminase-like domain-containing protein [Desulfogranum mediterraneum]
MNAPASSPKIAASLPVLATVVICTLPHLSNISLPAILLCCLMWSYLLAAAFRPLPLPGLILKTLAGSGLFLVAVASHEGLTVEAFVALLTLMISLKMFEFRSQRDAVITVILCYFLIISGMFFNDSVLATLYILFTIIVTTAVLIRLHFPALRARATLRLAGLLALQALPVMLVFFLFFPRFHGGLWGRPPLVSARSGFNDTITFGSVSRLARSGKVAFRAAFEGTLPPQEQRYWRGIVLWQFDGSRWQRGVGRRTLAPAAATALKDRPSNYTITLEPHNQPWLFTLDAPSRLDSPRARQLSDYSWYLGRPLTSRTSYRVSSWLASPLTAPGAPLAAALQLPARGNPRARELAREWQQQDRSQAAFIQQLYRYFRLQGFRYTLDPQAAPSKDDAVDHFLFTSREGFCEHYAAGMAFLLRAAGIPVRLVAGYLGGQENPYGSYLLIRQADAHVWCEVRDQEGRWQRFDPTTTVAPERLNSRFQELLFPDKQEALLTSLGISWPPPWLRPLTDLWDFINSRWNQGVMEYSRPSQVRLFSRMGIDLRIKQELLLAAVIVLGLLAAALFLTLALNRRPRSARDPVSRLWLRFCDKLARAGIHRAAHQGPMAFARVIARQRPDLAASAREVISLYIRLRFSREGDTTQLAAFRRAVTDFSTRTRETP